MTPPLLTLITVTKDDAAGLARTLASAEGLRRSGAEHVVVDGSESAMDNAAGATHDAGVRFLRRPPLGVSDAFNAGLAEARAEWIWFLNGGDQVDPRLGAAFLRTLLQSTKADVVIGAITYEGLQDAHPHPPPGRRWPPVAPWIPHPASLVRRSVFERFGNFDARYRIAMDYEWWLRVLGRDVAVDVFEVPFAVFAAGGMSQRPESHARLIRERDDIIRRHQGHLWSSEARRGLRFGRAWLRALFARRL